ncbi:MAG: helix-turn-helix domain-containing protein [Bacteroidales bacterium]|nr:helix-turn-helix domain-containing protein [Bacteroidales bacterium]MBR4325332.1 helix-turn-helix domain-containing protein [Bacteroidales bacterium]
MNENNTIATLLQTLIDEVHNLRMAITISQKDWLNTNEAAFLLGVEPQTINQRASDKEITYYKGGKYRSYNKKEVVDSFFGNRTRVASNAEVEQQAMMERIQRKYGKTA